MKRPALYRTAARFARLFQAPHNIVKGTVLDPARGWTRTRDLPPVARQTFKDYWRSRQ